MANIRPPSLQAQRTASVIRHLLGSTKLGWAFLAILVLLSFDWFSNGVTDAIDGAAANKAWLYVRLTLFPLLILGLWWWIRATNETVRLHVHQIENTPKVQALILFLSKMPEDRLRELEQMVKSQKPSLPDIQPLLPYNWCMPFAAVAHHLERLTDVIVIPSEDSQSQADNFLKLLNKLTPGQRITGVSLAAVNGKYANGIDYENAGQLVEGVHAAYEHLAAKGITSPCDILVDVTGGSKVPTIAGAMMALGEGRHFQYVSTKDYKVLTYDITYLAPES